MKNALARVQLGPSRLAAAVFVAVVVLVMITAPLIAPYDPLAQNPSDRLLPLLSPGHFLGTDEFGRDVLSRIVWGARVELLVALGATLLGLLLGTTIGLLGGYFGSWIEVVSMRGFVDVVLAFPPIILALLAVTLYGPGATTLTLVMAVIFAPGFARVAYGQTMSAKRLEYVEASIAFGAPAMTRVFRVIAPNIAGPIVVQFSNTIASAILVGAGLSFLGLGVVPPTASWGGMVAQGQRYLASNPQLLAVPGVTIILTILAFGLLSNLLRDAFDPKARKGARS